MSTFSTIHSKPSQPGFTLIELLIVISIAGVLFGLAVPAFSTMLAQTQQSSALTMLFAHHQLARSEAIKTNRHLLLCKSRDGLQCTKNSQWQEGWLIFTDKNQDRVVSPGEQIISTQDALNTHLSLTYRGFGSHNYIRYYPDGHTTSNGTFTLCNRSQSTGKALIISRTGRARIASKTPGNNTLSCN